MIFGLDRDKTVSISCSLHGDRARMRTCFFSRHAYFFGRHFIGTTVELFQSLALHLQFNLRILLEDLRVPLAKHLRDPLVRYASGAQPGRIGRAEIVDEKVRYLRAAQRGFPTPIAVSCLGDKQEALLLMKPAAYVRNSLGMWQLNAVVGAPHCLSLELLEEQMLD